MFCSKVNFLHTQNCKLLLLAVDIRYIIIYITSLPSLST